MAVFTLSLMFLVTLDNREGKVNEREGAIHIVAEGRISQRGEN